MKRVQIGIVTVLLLVLIRNVDKLSVTCNRIRSANHNTPRNHAPGTATSAGPAAPGAPGAPGATDASGAPGAPGGPGVPDVPNAKTGDSDMSAAGGVILRRPVLSVSSSSVPSSLLRPH